MPPPPSSVDESGRPTFLFVADLSFSPPPPPLSYRFLHSSLSIRILFGVLCWLGYKQLITQKRKKEKAKSIGTARGIQMCRIWKQFGSRQKRVHIAITRLTDLWRTSTRLWMGKDRSATIMISESLQRPSDINKDRQPPAIVVSSANKKGAGLA